ncbi:MAG: trimethylamine methyltransferase MttB [Chloroflexota bacterium]|nr:trimethylamine methyltransferase family protein [Caldilinea sp.]GIK72708.1 MAG: trimethylamine methyltransferase MttB [Chloroflexota bacterium]
MRPILSVADPALLDRIIDEARCILATTGMEIRGAAMHRLLLEAGLPAAADGRILFPDDVVDRALKSAPASFTLFDRDGNPHAEIGGDHVHFTPGSSGLKVQDHRTGHTRQATTADFVEYVRVCDGLEHVRYLATAFSTGDDIEANVSDAWRLLLCLTNSKRPVVSGAFTEHGVPRMAEMMQLFRRDRADLIARPMSIFTITATGNFRYSEDSCQNLIDCVKAGIPVEIVPVTLMGLTAPVTLVGAAVFHAVDTLAGVVMSQLVRPGAPVLYGGAPAEFHMRETTSPMLGVQALYLDVINAQIGKRLGLPVQAYMGLSDAKELDAQAGAETFGSALLAALAGVNSVSGPGMLDFVLVFSLPKLVFDNEVCGQALRLVRPLQIVDDLPTGHLVEAQLADMHLITAAHTLTHWEQHLYLPGAVYDRKNREAWQRMGGGKTLWQRAVDEVEQRLTAYTPIDVDPRAVAEMERLIRSGMSSDAPLPAIPGPRHESPGGSEGRRQRRFRR